MNLNEAKEILEKNGYIVESRIWTDEEILKLAELVASKTRFSVEEVLRYIERYMTLDNMSFNDAFGAVQYGMIKQCEAEEPGYMRGELSYWDRRRMEQGRPPIWAKSMKNIPARKKELRQSSSYSEIAMRSVNTEDGKVKMPYSESDWRRDKQAAIEMNNRIGEELKKFLTVDYDHISADQNEVSVVVGKNYVFRVKPHGPGYYCLRFAANSIFDRESTRAKSLKEIGDWINSHAE